MSDNRHRRSDQNRLRINSVEGYELTYWTRQLECTRQQLLAALAAVGLQVDKPGVYFERQRCDPKGDLACA
ncbi:MAG: hypothetical protein JWQ72_1375 [Polaromonas sp.]|nr:hypothetical protein [Polaromonas sp.]